MSQKPAGIPSRFAQGPETGGRRGQNDAAGYERRRNSSLRPEQKRPPAANLAESGVWPPMQDEISRLFAVAAAGGFNRALCDGLCHAWGTRTGLPSPTICWRLLTTPRG